MIYELEGRRPLIDPGCFVAPNAAIIGSVTVHAEASIWFSVTIRADNEIIIIGARSNVQDGCVLHVDPGFPLHIGEDVTVGHQVMLHGCTVGDGSLIGIGAVVLNGAVIGRNCLIGANALVTENMQVPDGTVVMGSPGRVVRTLDEGTRAVVAAGALRYVSKGRLFRERLKAVSDD